MEPIRRDSSTLTDARAMRALAHPDRLRLLGELRRGGPQTVGTLAAALGIAVGSASYHLKTLETFGFIEPSPEHSSDRRERWFKATHSQTRLPQGHISRAEHGDLTAYNALRRSIYRRYLSALEEYIDYEGTLPEEWAANAVNSDVELHLTAAELGDFRGELEELIKRWTEMGSGSKRADAAPVTFIYHAFRRP